MDGLQATPKSRTFSAGVWVLLYFLANLALTIHNKWVLSRVNFRFPWSLTALHIGVSGIGSWIFCTASSIPKKDLDFEAWKSLLSFSVLYALNIAMSNVSLAYVSLSFHQIVRSSVPAVILLIEWGWLAKSHSTNRKLSLIPLILGVIMATVGEFRDVEFTSIGLILTLIGVLLAALKGVTTNLLMVGPLKMHPLQVISYMAGPAAFQCLLYGLVAGEFSDITLLLKRLSRDATIEAKHGGPIEYPVISLLGKLAVNGLLAFVLNWVSFTANKKTSALTMTVVANVKQVVSIAMAIYIFHTELSPIKILGIVLALGGATWYSFSKSTAVCAKSLNSESASYGNLGFSKARSSSEPLLTDDLEDGHN